MWRGGFEWSARDGSRALLRMSLVSFSNYVLREMQDFMDVRKIYGGLIHQCWTNDVVARRCLGTKLGKRKLGLIQRTDQEMVFCDDR